MAAAPDEPEPAAVTSAADRLYAAPPEDFVRLRGELARATQSEAAKAIGALRKPTLSASVVNRFAHHDPDAVARLDELGDRLRQATADLDAARLRELSTERRALVTELTAAAFAHSGTGDPSAAQRDEVSATFDAAVADPQIAASLGRLTRPQQFSGFGLAAGPELTLVRGGGDHTSGPRPTKTVTKLRTALTAADEHLATAEADEQRAHERVTTLTDELARTQRDLDEAKHDLERTRGAVRTARTDHRRAQSALGKAERQLDG